MARGVTFEIVAMDWQTPLALIETYEHAELVARFNDVGTWQIDIPASDPVAIQLRNAARPRVIWRARPGGEVFRSGPATRWEEAMDESGHMLSVSGVDDAVWLTRRLAHPQPLKASPPWDGTAYDVITGNTAAVIASAVNRNAGPVAIAARQVLGLTVPTPPALGPAITLSLRWQLLFDVVRAAAEAAGIGFRVEDLAFEAFQPSGSAVFSMDLGTLAGWSATLEAPQGNHVYVAGSGQGTARTVREVEDASSVTAWQRLEMFQDRRDTNAAADLDQAGAETLAEALAPSTPTVELQALDTESQAFLTDWSLGSMATAVIGATTITTVIREVNISMNANEPPTITPVLGGQSVDLAVWRRMSQVERRVRQLERI